MKCHLSYVRRYLFIFIRFITLHNEELSDLYSLPNIVRVVKSRIMRWAGHVARMGDGRGGAQGSDW